MTSRIVRRATRLGALLSAATLLACSDSGPGSNPLLQDCDLFSDMVFDGGVSRDGIPALNSPEVIPASADTFLVPNDRILGVVVNGAARAYPFGIMWWHEVANDTLGGAPMLLSYCPLTGSGLAFDPTVDGQVRAFGVSGLIFENNLMMFDRETESVWPQLLKSARCGPAKGTPLTTLAITETTWGRWLEMYPSTSVITTNTGFSRDYGRYPYGSYDLPDNNDLLFPSSPFNITRPPKELVLAVFGSGEAVGFPFFALQDRAVQAGSDLVAINETAGNQPIVVLYHDPSLTAMAYERDPGGQTLDFQVSTQDPTLFEDVQTGSQWNQAGLAVSGPLTGTQLVQHEQAYVLFWFAWSIFHRFERVVQ